jgi:hypothetical protein
VKVKEENFARNENYRMTNYFVFVKKRYENILSIKHSFFI